MRGSKGLAAGTSRGRAFRREEQPGKVSEAGDEVTGSQRSRGWCLASGTGGRQISSTSTCPEGGDGGTQTRGADR